MTAKSPAAPRARRFYEKALDEAELADFRDALKIEGDEAEIALLRLRLRTVLQDHDTDLALMLRGVDLLSRAVARRYQLGGNDVEQLVAPIVYPR